MKASLSIEVFGDAENQRLRLFESIADQVTPGIGRAITGGYRRKRPWVAEIIGVSQRYGFERSFLDPKKDYSRSNAIGSRGVRLFFILESGRLYEINEQTSWRRWLRWYAVVSDSGDIVHVSKEEAHQWLRDRLVSMS